MKIHYINIAVAAYVLMGIVVVLGIGILVIVATLVELCRAFPVAALIAGLALLWVAALWYLHNCNPTLIETGHDS